MRQGLTLSDGCHTSRRLKPKKYRRYRPNLKEDVCILLTSRDFLKYGIKDFLYFSSENDCKIGDVPRREEGGGGGGGGGGGSRARTRPLRLPQRDHQSLFRADPLVSPPPPPPGSETPDDSWVRHWKGLRENALTFISFLCHHHHHHHLHGGPLILPCIDIPSDISSLHHLSLPVFLSLSFHPDNPLPNVTHHPNQQRYHRPCNCHVKIIQDDDNIIWISQKIESSPESDHEQTMSWKPGPGKVFDVCWHNGFESTSPALFPCPSAPLIPAELWWALYWRIERPFWTRGDAGWFGPHPKCMFLLTEPWERSPLYTPGPVS